MFPAGVSTVQPIEKNKIYVSAILLTVSINGAETKGFIQSLLDPR
jgi:hypothetical protein